MRNCRTRVLYLLLIFTISACSSPGVKVERNPAETMFLTYVQTPPTEVTFSAGDHASLQYAASFGYPEAMALLAVLSDLGPLPDEHIDRPDRVDDMMEAARSGFEAQLRMSLSWSPTDEEMDTYSRTRLAFFLYDYAGEDGLPIWESYSGEYGWPFESLEDRDFAKLVGSYGLLAASLGRLNVKMPQDCLRVLRPEEDPACGLFWRTHRWGTEAVLWHAGHLARLVELGARQGMKTSAYLLAAAYIYDLPFVSDAVSYGHAGSGLNDPVNWVGNNERGWSIRNTRSPNDWPNGPDIPAAIEILTPYAKEGDWYAALSLAALTGEQEEQEAYLTTLLCDMRADRRRQQDDGPLRAFLEATNRGALPLFPRSGPFFDKWEAVWEACRL